MYLRRLTDREGDMNTGRSDTKQSSSTRSVSGPDHSPSLLSSLTARPICRYKSHIAARHCFPNTVRLTPRWLLGTSHKKKRKRRKRKRVPHPPVIPLPPADGSTRRDLHRGQIRYSVPTSLFPCHSSCPSGQPLSRCSVFVSRPVMRTTCNKMQSERIYKQTRCNEAFFLEYTR